MTDLNEYRILRVIDSNNVVIIRNQKNIISNIEKKVINKNLELKLETTRRKKQSWIIGGSLGGALIIGILSSFLIK